MLDPPATTTGNGVAGAPGLCTPAAPPTGTTTEFDEGIDINKLSSIWPELATVPAEIAEQIEIDAGYGGYLERQARDIAAFRRDEALLLPEALDYGAVGGLSAEVRGKLASARPATLGAASLISGITPAALIALLQYVRRRPEAA